MSLIPSYYFQTVVSIGIYDDNKNAKWIGTGFFVGRIVSENTYKPFLITNKHVIQNQDIIVIRMVEKNTKNLKSFEIKINQNSSVITYHPNDNVDIAAITIDGSVIMSENLEFSFFDIDTAAYSSKELRDSGFNEGNLIYMLGYPMGLVNIDSNQPICRMGCVARIDEKQINRSSNVLLDVQNFPGNSGSPVISKPEIISIKGTKHLERSVLIGIVHSYIPYRETLLNTQTKEIVEIRSENSGIANMHPVELIRDVIDIVFPLKKDISQEDNGSKEVNANE